jgi:hypothetical protein
VEGAVVALDEEALGRTGETGRRGEGGVTSEWSMDVNIAFACSVAMVRQQMKRKFAYTNETLNLSTVEDKYSWHSSI